MSRETVLAAEIDFVDRVAAADIGTQLVEVARATYSNGMYAKAGKRLRVAWGATSKFRAEAAIGPDGADVIAFSYGVPVELYREAFVFTQYCASHFSRTQYDAIYALMSYDERRSVLPAGLTCEDCKVEMMRLGMTWLYLHEQAHLTQHHGEIAKAAGAPALLATDLAVVDAPGQAAPSLSGRDAAIRHAFELSADHEAVGTLLATLSVEDGPLKPATLWLLTAQLTLMFQFFYGDDTRAMDPVAAGTHPHPSIRMRLALRQMLGMIREPAAAKFFGALGDDENASRLMEHAMYTAAMYWHVRYLEPSGLPPFLTQALDEGVIAPSYIDQVTRTWLELRPMAVQRHFGRWKDLVLDFQASRDMA